MSAAARPVARAVPNVFCGTSDFAASVLGALANSPHEPSLVVAPPDRRRGRGRKVGPPPVAEAARELGIDLHQTASINEEESRRAVLEREPELAVVCAFGQLIKQPLLGELLMLNIHPSLLPRWRGAAPLERAIMAGDSVTGVCLIRLTEGLDSGPVALREEVPIGAADTYGTLAPRLAELSGRMLIAALDLQAEGALEARSAEQGEEGITYAEKIDSGERRIDPSQTAGEEVLRVRGLSPHIGAYAELADGERLGIRAVETEAGSVPAAGRFERRGDELLLGCTSGALRIAELQPAGGRWMAVGDYLRGRGLPAPVSVPGSAA